MRLIVGLGNPGDKYAHHRHNVGFMAVDAIAEVHGFAPERAKFQGLLREGALDTDVGREKTLILKPQTFMNESGRSVGEAIRFYKLEPADVVVLYDELDLAPGKLRVKRGGGAAGHNGIRSIASHIGPEFDRLRIGIGHPGDKSRVTGHVLGDFSKADQDWLHPLLDAIAKAAPHLAARAADKFQTAVAHTIAPPPDRSAKTKDTEPKKVKATEGGPSQKDPAPAAPPKSNADAPPSPPEPRGGALAEGLKKLFGRN